LEDYPTLDDALADLNDLDRLLAGGALHVVSAREVYGAGGPVDPERVVAFVAAATEQSLADGFGGLAMSTDATALVGTPVQKDAFARCEFLVDRYMAGHPLSALCGYGLGLGNDTVAEFALLHMPRPSNEPPLQVFGCADGAVGLAGECDPVGVAALGRVLPRLLPADGEAVVVDQDGIRTTSGLAAWPSRQCDARRRRAPRASGRTAPRGNPRQQGRARLQGRARGSSR